MSSIAIGFYLSVALFTRAWIEISLSELPAPTLKVALFTRAWIEISKADCNRSKLSVALFTRAWIEILSDIGIKLCTKRRPLHEGVD